MKQLSFHLAPEDGLEFVFASGRAASYPLHTHSTTFTLTLVRRGTVSAVRPGGCFIYRGGEIYIDAPHEAHSPAYGDNYDLVSLCLNKERLITRSGADLSQLFLARAETLSAKGLLNSQDVARLLSGLGEVLSNNDCRRKARLEPLSELAGFEPDLVRLADTYGLYPPQSSSSHFSRRFKKALGLTPHQYLLQCRIRSAKKMLGTGLSIAEVAQLAGFCDQSHLSRRFKKSLGLSPGQYIKSRGFFES